MDDFVRIVRVFVSSPGDCQVERAILDEVAQRINETPPTADVRVELFKWERNVVPRIGPPAQTVVDVQTPIYGIYLGIMAQRFGTPTGTYGSGTEKEFRDALKTAGKLGEPWILFYFNDQPIRLARRDLAQYAKVLAFREELEKKGLVATYEGVRGTPTAFFEQVEQHLRMILQRIRPPEPSRRAAVARAGRRPPKTVEAPMVPAAYRSWLQAQCAELEFRGLKLKHGQAVRLNHVYVPLATSAGDEESGHERHAQRLLFEEPRLLLDLLGKRSLYVSGAPGSGKSMFCRWVAWLACAGSIPPHEVDAPEGYAEALGTSLCGRLPLLVRLRDFWPFLPDTAGLHELSRAELETGLGAWVEAKRLADLAWPSVRVHLERGSALLILDGVDEVPLSLGGEPRISHPRSLLLTGLAAAVPEWTKAGNRVLVTSRPYGLTGTQAQKLGIAQAPVEDLADQAQALLARRWFHVLAEEPATAETTAAEMLDHVREREWLEPLTGNPMLLTAMCIVYGEGKRLPQDKHDLYARIVDNVLHNRYADDPKQIDLMRNRLSVIAHGMHTGEGLGETRSTPQAEATYHELDRMIQAYRERSAWTEPGFEGAVATREDLLSQSGLLLPRADRRAGFYHFSFQDFLAAERMADLDSDRLPDVFQERATAPEWRSALSFVFGSLLTRNTSPGRGVRLLTRLVQRTGMGEYGLQVVIGECVEVLLGRGIHLQAADEERVRAFCLAAIEREAPLPERHALGLTLGRLGDPRIVTDLRARGAFVEVPAGDYVVGANRRRYTLKRSFLMSRYPVTNSQYALFVSEGGYGDDQWWSEAGRRWRDLEASASPFCGGAGDGTIRANPSSACRFGRPRRFAPGPAGDCQCLPNGNAQSAAPGASHTHGVMR